MATSLRRSALWTSLVLSAGTMASTPRTPQSPADDGEAATGAILIDAVPVPLNARDPSVTTVADFRYAGGLMLRSRQTSLIHGLSDIVMIDTERFAAVGDDGAFLEARLVFDQAGHLSGVTDATVTRLLGQDGRVLTGASADAEGLALLPTGDRLVSFERRARIWLYPKDGGPPRAVPSPDVPLQSNAGMEALTADPDIGDDAYMVGVEDSGRTWTCHVASRCIRGPTVQKPRDFGLVAMNRLPGASTAYLLRAYDPARGPRIVLKIVNATAVVTQMTLAPPLTVDNFEGLTSVARADGRRFYLISDDNARTSQRTLLLAFDWAPRRSAGLDRKTHPTVRN